MKIQIASCKKLPEPDPDEPLLQKELLRRGLSSKILAWDDPEVDWSAQVPTLLRSTWNYHQHLAPFLSWAKKVEQQGFLWNPFTVIRWNTHKRYLTELASHGLSVTPTLCVSQGEEANLLKIMEEYSWNTVVIKPAVSASSFATRRFNKQSLTEGQTHLSTLLSERDVLIQSYLSSVEDYGERSLVWIDGKITHAIRKSPRFSAQDESVTGPVPISSEECVLAEAAIEFAREKGEILYARCDLAKNHSGKSVIMELELIEPSLFFAQGPEALERFAKTLQTRVEAFYQAR